MVGRPLPALQIAIKTASIKSIMQMVEVGAWPTFSRKDGPTKQNF